MNFAVSFSSERSTRTFALPASFRHLNIQISVQMLHLQAMHVYLCPTELHCFTVNLLHSVLMTLNTLGYKTNLTLLHTAFRCFYTLSVPYFYISAVVLSDRQTYPSSTLQFNHSQLIQLTGLWKLFCLLSWKLHPPHGSKETFLPVNVNRKALTACC